jgi:hypothetical protein
VVLLQNLVLSKFNPLIGQVEKNVCGRKMKEVPGDEAFDGKEYSIDYRKREFNPS